MRTLHFEVEIDAPVQKVYDSMLGLSSKDTYEQWTSKFNPTSTYRGSWNKGGKIHFLGTDEKGDVGGMVSEIVENLPTKFVSIKHCGILVGDQEITTGPEVEKWAGGLENYTFRRNGERTIVLVDLQTPEEFSDHMNRTYPQALHVLKEICER